jgi:hypothetical protein
MSTETPKSDRSLADLFHGLVADSRSLLRQEVALAKAELLEKAVAYGRCLACIAAGALVALLGAVALLVAIIYGLQVALGGIMDRDAAYWLAPVIVGVVIGAIGWLLIQKGLHALRGHELTPRQTTESLKETGRWLKQKLT